MHWVKKIKLKNRTKAYSSQQQNCTLFFKLGISNYGVDPHPGPCA